MSYSHKNYWTHRSNIQYYTITLNPAPTQKAGLICNEWFKELLYQENGCVLITYGTFQDPQGLSYWLFMNYPKNCLVKNFKSMASDALALVPQFIFVGLIFLKGKCKQVLFKWMIWNVRAIGATNNTHNLWWANRGQSICPPAVVHNQHSDNGKSQYKK